MNELNIELKSFPNHQYYKKNLFAQTNFIDGENMIFV